MKKVLIKFLVLIGIMFAWIMFNNTISFGAGQLYNYLFEGSSHIYKNSFTTMNNSNISESNLTHREEWVSALFDMIKYINNSNYTDIAEDNSKECMEIARRTVYAVEQTFATDTSVLGTINAYSGGKYEASSAGLKKFSE